MYIIHLLKHIERRNHINSYHNLKYNLVQYKFDIKLKTFNPSTYIPLLIWDYS